MDTEQDERFTFAVRHRDLLERHRAVLESFGYTCRVEASTVTRHNFELLTLVATPPVTPTRRERGCLC